MFFLGWKKYKFHSSHMPIKWTSATHIIMACCTIVCVGSDFLHFCILHLSSFLYFRHTLGTYPTLCTLSLLNSNMQMQNLSSIRNIKIYSYYIRTIFSISTNFYITIYFTRTLNRKKKQNCNGISNLSCKNSRFSGTEKSIGKGSRK